MMLRVLPCTPWVSAAFVLTTNLNVYLTRPITEGEIFAHGKVTFASRNLFHEETVFEDSAGNEIGRGNRQLRAQQDSAETCVRLRMIPILGCHEPRKASCTSNGACGGHGAALASASRSICRPFSVIQMRARMTPCFS